MGGQSSASQAREVNEVEEVDERAPLLGGDENLRTEPEAPAKRAGNWVIRNAVIIFMSLLVLAVIIVLCIFFASKSHCTKFASIIQIWPPRTIIDQHLGYQSKKLKTKVPLCLTPACVHASSEILYNLSPEYKNLDPCDDFEELVCGGWDERHDLRPDQGDAFTGTIMSENSQMLLRHILEAPYPEDSDVCT